MGQRRRFTPELKRQAVQLLNAGQRPAAEIARELGDSAQSPVQVAENKWKPWRSISGVRPACGAIMAELARLKRELARVTEERDILKKAAAYFARESR